MIQVKVVQPLACVRKAAKCTFTAIVGINNGNRTISMAFLLMFQYLLQRTNFIAIETGRIEIANNKCEWMNVTGQIGMTGQPMCVYIINVIAFCIRKIAIVLTITAAKNQVAQ